MGTYANLLSSQPVEKSLEKEDSQATVFSSEHRSEIRSQERKLPIKRRTKRYSFEFYDDQITALKRLKYQAEMDGESLSLSDIVREALDDYLGTDKR